MRHEESVAASPVTPERLARFVGYGGTLGPWDNPLEEWRRVCPPYFGTGRLKWDGSSGWSEFVNAAFFLLHGDLMERLGYATGTEVATARSRLSAEQADCLLTARKLGRQRQAFEQAARNRMAVTERLDGEVTDLRRVCSERLQAIESLDAEVQRLRRVCGERPQTTDSRPD